ncbi:MAG: hypothetical protein Q8880_03735 [Bacteroidota bacterium]|nr:hypothetical protein [Bacteroidota bacterium]
MKKTILIILFLTLIFNNVFSQQPAEEPKTLLYMKENSFGVEIHTSGWGFFYRNGKHVTGKLKKVWDIEFVSVSSPKEYSISSQFNENSKEFVLGKLNSFFILRTGIGFQKTLFNKPEKRGVEIRFFNFTGISNGILKPVYLDILHFDSNNQNIATVTTERYDPNLHDKGNIYGKASFLKGIDELSYVPGLYLKCGFNFDFAESEENAKVRLFEIGAVLDAFPKKIPLMAYVNNNNFFFNLYIAFHIGKKKVQ